MYPLNILRQVSLKQPAIGVDHYPERLPKILEHIRSNRNVMDGPELSRHSGTNDTECSDCFRLELLKRNANIKLRYTKNQLTREAALQIEKNRRFCGACSKGIYLQMPNTIRYGPTAICRSFAGY